jgi:hypothetical protein
MYVQSRNHNIPSCWNKNFVEISIHRIRREFLPELSPARLTHSRSGLKKFGYFAEEDAFPDATDYANPFKEPSA